MRNLKYKFVSKQNYEDNYKAKFPFAPANSDGSEFLICGEGQLNESQMNEYKANNWS